MCVDVGSAVWALFHVPTISASHVNHCESSENSELLCASCISRGDQGDRLSVSQVIGFGLVES